MIPFEQIGGDEYSTPAKGYAYRMAGLPAPQRGFTKKVSDSMRLGSSLDETQRVS